MRLDGTGGEREKQRERERQREGSAYRGHVRTSPSQLHAVSVHFRLIRLHHAFAVRRVHPTANGEHLRPRAVGGLHHLCGVQRMGGCRQQIEFGARRPRAVCGVDVPQPAVSGQQLIAVVEPVVRLHCGGRRGAVRQINGRAHSELRTVAGQHRPEATLHVTKSAQRSTTAQHIIRQQNNTKQE
jgi:hypothetical protein